ncbi:MAG: MFS transporter, partial [Anaerolineae bacterium]
GQPAAAVYLFAVVVGVATGGVVIMIYSIFPDIPDIDELDSGQRREGIYAAAFTFMRKLSSAVALFVVSTGLSLAGYLPPVEEVVDGATRLVEQPQTDTFLLVLRLIFALVPIVFLALALVFALRFPLTAAVHRRLRAVLDVVRHGGSLSEEEAAEARALHRLLTGGGEG